MIDCENCSVALDFEYYDDEYQHMLCVECDEPHCDICFETCRVCGQMNLCPMCHPQHEEICDDGQTGLCLDTDLDGGVHG